MIHQRVVETQQKREKRQLRCQNNGVVRSNQQPRDSWYPQFMAFQTGFT